MFNLSLCYFNYGGSILYGGIHKGKISGMMSISKSISLSSGTMGKSTWKTSGNTYTIWTD